MVFKISSSSFFFFLKDSCSFYCRNECFLEAMMQDNVSSPWAFQGLSYAFIRYLFYCWKTSSYIYIYNIIEIILRSMVTTLRKVARKVANQWTLCHGATAISWQWESLILFLDMIYDNNEEKIKSSLSKTMGPLH